MESLTYQWNANDYAGHSAPQQQWAQALMAKLALHGHEAVLDVGCGDGKITAAIARRLPEGSVVGLDSSADMVAFAEGHYPPEAYPNLRFVHADARRLDSLDDFDEAFDVVFSNAALHWILDHRPVLRGIHRSLRAGGIALLQMGGTGNAAGLLRVLEAVMGTPRWRRYFAAFSFPYGFYGPEAYRRWLAEAGLHARRAVLLPKDMTHRGRDGLTGWIRTAWLPYTEQVPATDRSDFVLEVVDAYLEAYPLDANGIAHVRMMRLEVEAVKPYAKP